MAETTHGAATRSSSGFDVLAAICAVLAGLAGLAYGVAFVVLGNVGLSAGILLAGGLLSTVALTGVCTRLRPVDQAVATLALLLGAAGGLGAAIHGALDLATTLHPVAGTLPDAPNAVDPRGLLTFGVAGLGLFAVGSLIVRGGPFPRSLGVFAGLAAALMVLLYLARLIVLTPTSPLVLVPAVLSGFLVNPVLYVWLGTCLYRAAGHDDAGPRSAS